VKSEKANQKMPSSFVFLTVSHVHLFTRLLVHAFKFVQRAAVRAQRFAGFLYWQKHARMGIPQQL
jgi:hypothetical protein